MISGARRGSSRPILVETEAGARLVKLRGVPQGTGPLVAEIIVGELAAALGLAVPERCLVDLSADAHVPDGDDELDDVMRASGGTNLGFEYLDPARDLPAADAQTIPVADRAAILWLDRFVMNPDRTAVNPNLMVAGSRTWLIDHGAALGFQYDWSAVTAETARRAPVEFEPHLFAATVPPGELAGWDDLFASRLSPEVVARAVARVPDEFLRPMISPDAGADSLSRRRSAYEELFTARLQAPRPFLTATSPHRPPRGRPRPSRLERP